MQEELLPLFPLEVVLFPRTPLSLHIFEERYKAMIGAAIRDGTEFGMILAAEQGIHNVGCTAVVEKVTRRYPDGRLDILAKGRRRFEVLELNEEEACLRARVEFFDDEEPEDVPEALRSQALTAYASLRELVAELPEPDLSDPQISFQVAQCVTDLESRQALLRARSELERMKRLAEYLPTLAARQVAVSHARRVAPLNGHSRHITKF